MNLSVSRSYDFWNLLQITVQESDVNYISQVDFPLFESKRTHPLPYNFTCVRNFRKKKGGGLCPLGPYAPCGSYVWDIRTLSSPLFFFWVPRSRVLRVPWARPAAGSLWALERVFLILWTKLASSPLLNKLFSLNKYKRTWNETPVLFLGNVCFSHGKCKGKLWECVSTSCCCWGIGSRSDLASGRHKQGDLSGFSYCISPDTLSSISKFCFSLGSAFHAISYSSVIFQYKRNMWCPNSDSLT